MLPVSILIEVVVSTTIVQHTYKQLKVPQVRTDNKVWDKGRFGQISPFGNFGI